MVTVHRPQAPPQPLRRRHRNIFTDEEMRDFTYELAPDNIKNTLAAHEFSDGLMQSRPALRDSIPRYFVRMAQRKHSQRERYVEPDDDTNRAPFTRE